VHHKSLLYKEPTRCNFGSIVHTTRHTVHTSQPEILVATMPHII